MSDDRKKRRSSPLTGIGGGLSAAGTVASVIPGGQIVGGVLSGVGALVGGIGASQDAASDNQALLDYYEEQQELAEKNAKIQNEYNKKVFEAEKKDYYAQREFQFETAVKDWQYRNTIQDYNYLQSVRQFSKSVENFGDQLGFNKLAATAAYEGEAAALGDFLTGQFFAREAEQVALNEFQTSQAFQKEGQLIESIQARGQAQVGQAGRVRNKAAQSTLAEYGRNMAIMKESLSSTVAQTQRNMRVLDANQASTIAQTKRNLKDIALRKYGSDLSAKAQLMVAPQALPYAPAPEKGPERTFVEPPEVLPGFVAPPVQRSTTAPLISAFGSAASSLAGINWGGTQQPSRNTMQQGYSLFK